MVRKAEEELEQKFILLYKGDWDILKEVLASTRITPTEFIRKLVRRTIIRIKTRSKNDLTS
jgi:hypothetical protein